MKEDLRVKKTKAALFSAFYHLLGEKSFEEITVNELCERAEIRRATFYKHYNDKQDFLVGVVKKFRADFDVIFKKNNRPGALIDYLIGYCDTVIKYLCTYESLVQNILRGQLRAPFINIIVQQNYLDTKEKIEESVRGGLSISVSPENAASMITGGITLAIINWVEDDTKGDLERLRSDLFAIISRILLP